MTSTNDESPDNPTRFLILRHGETAAPDLFHGSESDIGLGPRGFEQANAAALPIAARRPDAIYCSGMRRSVETARPIAAASGLDLHFEPDFRERRMGSLSGAPRVEGWPIYEEAKARWMSGDLDFTHEGGESFAQIQARIVPAFERLAALNPGRTVVLVGHGVANRVLITSVAEGLSPADFDRVTIEFVKVMELVLDADRWRLVPGEA